MKKIAKSLTAALLLGLTLLVFTLPLQADAAGRVVDDAGLFTAAETAELLEKVAEARATTGVDFAIWTTDSTYGLSGPNIGEYFYETYGYGVVEQTGGMLFVIDMGEREFYAMATGNVEDILKNQRTLNRLLDDIYDALNRTNYAKAARTFVSESYKLVVKQTNPWLARLSVVNIAGSLGLGLLAGALVVGIMLLMHRNSLPKAPPAQSYFDQAGVRVTHTADHFAGTHTSRVPIPRDPPSGSGGGGGGGSSFSGSSSGGRSFSGGSRKF